MAEPFVTVNIKLDTRKLDGMSAGLQRRAEKVLDKAASTGEGLTKDYITQMHVIDTGALHSSIGWKRESPLVRVVSDGVEYGVYQHEGYHRGGHYQPARPFMRAAFERLRPTLVEAWRQLFR